MRERKVVVLASGNGSNFEALVRRARVSGYPISFPLLITDNPNAPVIERARRLGVPYRVVEDPGKPTVEAIKSVGRVDAVVLAGYMKILPPETVREFQGRILNIHPSLLPAFKGRDAIKRAWASGVKFTGVTVHIVTEKVDSGPILAQRVVPLFKEESLEGLEQRIHAVEHALYFDTLVKFLFKRRPRYALLSSYEKSPRLVRFAHFLQEYGYSIAATSGTAKYLSEHGVYAVDVSALSGFPEVFGGRVKTLNPYIMGGILFHREYDKEMAEELDVPQIDFVFVQLYPFKETLKETKNVGELVDMIDIGGVALIRAAAKNHEFVVVITDPEDMVSLMLEMEENEGRISDETRQKLAIKAFARTAEYDVDIYEGLGGLLAPSLLYKNIFIHLKDPVELRYGENPHQEGWVYTNPGSFLAATEQLHGPELSYNNILDAYSAWSTVQEFSDHAIAIVKHGSPAAGAEDETPMRAYLKTLMGDMQAAYGGVIALNFAVEEDLARKLKEHFYEVIVATDYSDDALDILMRKSRLRILKIDIFKYRLPRLQMLMQGNDMLVQTLDYDPPYDVIESKTEPLTEEEIADVIFGLKMVKWAKSNAAVVVKNRTLFGTGSGLVDRVSAVKVALEKAGDNAFKGVLVSDGFFPFPDSIEWAYRYGINVVAEPGGSKRDEEVIAKAKELGIKLVFTGKRLFRH
ncbi:MAG: bifunctional phosphoribosylaminoimidazolecarboxamide formyltransferase/IMP cyclohydrolase [Thermotogae bacterium]|nr:bifunctional phosphoribosylaminoimidazolecarboxamide formyltransferase/IMP cyclohydrolase [Thermotogota bacterium]